MNQKAPPVAPPAPAKDWLAELQTDAKPRKVAMTAFGPPGIGKTEFGAALPNPVFLIDDKEDGVNTLKSSGLIDAGIPVFPAATNWTDALAMVAAVVDSSYDSLVIDTIGGMERLCHHYVCNRDFKGKWAEGFLAYAKGYETALPEWLELLNGLDRVRDAGKRVLLLAHSQVKPYKNPLGEDYDRFTPAVHPKTWNLTHRWSDVVLFLNYHIEVDESGTRAKGKGGQARNMHTEYCAAFEAKNRHRLPAVISMGNSGKEAWGNLTTAIDTARKG